MFFSVLRYLGLIALCATSLPAQSAQTETCNAAAAFESAKARLAEKLYEQASQSLDRVRTCPTLSPVERFEMGWLYGRARHFDVALQVFDLVPADTPDPLTHGYAIALSEFELSDYKGAITTLQTVESKLSLDEKSVNLLAVSFSKIGLYREAHAVLAAELQKDPADLTSYLNLVAVCAEEGDFKTAADVASRATQLFPTSPEVFVLHGAANTLLGQLNEAYRDFARSMQLAPDRPDIRFFLALTDYKEGRFAEAVGVLREAIKQGLQDSDLHYLLAECLLKMNAADTATALQQLHRALDLNADSVAARTLRGKLLLETGHPDQAATDLEFATQHEPDSRSATYNLARAYRALGRSAEAQAIFEGLRDRPSNTLGEMSDRRLNEVLSYKGKQQ